jgi:hypothetical protein
LKGECRTGTEGRQPEDEVNAQGCISRALPQHRVAAWLGL